MTMQEAARVVQMIHTAYPADRKTSAEELADRIDMWAVFFADTPAYIVNKVVMSWIKNNTFMPTVEEIGKACKIQKEQSEKIAEAGFIDQIHITPEQEARLDALWEDLRGDEE